MRIAEGSLHELVLLDELERLLEIELAVRVSRIGRRAVEAPCW